MNPKWVDSKGHTYTTGEYFSPRDLDGNPKYESYEHHLNDKINMYYHLWAHRTTVTITSLLKLLGIEEEGMGKNNIARTLNRFSVDWEAAMSALRMHGVDVEYIPGTVRLRVLVDTENKDVQF